MCSLYNPYPNGQLLRLRPGYYSRVRVITPNGRPDERVKPGEEGELIIDAGADTIFTGYLNRPDADADKLRDGWYYTGDMVVLHPGGDVDLRGRVDDMVRSGGENIFPEEIEIVLAKAPGVAEAAVIGLPDPRWGEIAVGCIVGKGITAEALDAHCRSSTLAAFKRPKAYLFLDQLPRNATKVIRRELRATAAKAREAGSLQTVGAQPARQSA
jgi:2-furoate---CoA ligase